MRYHNALPLAAAITGQVAGNKDKYMTIASPRTLVTDGVTSLGISTATGRTGANSFWRPSR